MPFGIFLFSLKSEFQKSEENGEKRRKPEKISGFSVGIFFVNTSWRRHPDLNRGIKVLQTSALPLGYVAVFFFKALMFPARLGGTSVYKQAIFRSSGLQKSTGTKCFVPVSFWSGLRGSNPPPRPWQGRALPNELNPHKVVPPVGIEPTTRGFSVPCSTN